MTDGSSEELRPLHVRIWEDHPATEAEQAALLRRARDPEYNAKVKAMLDRIAAKPRVPTYHRVDGKFVPVDDPTEGK